VSHQRGQARRKPTHDQFERRNVWSLFNAFTESLKDSSLAELPKRTEALHGLMDCPVRLITQKDFSNEEQER
jgi:hypothetical protein